MEMSGQLHAPARFWMRWRREKFLVPAGIRTSVIEPVVQFFQKSSFLLWSAKLHPDMRLMNVISADFSLVMSLCFNVQISQPLFCMGVKLGLLRVFHNRMLRRILKVITGR
jgi:hypothetical protein